MKYTIKDCCNMAKEYIIYYSNPMLRKAKGINLALNMWKFGEKNPDKIIYYITDISSGGSGIFSLYLDIIEELSYAKAMGWIPVVDDTDQLLRRTKVCFRKNQNIMNQYFDFSNQITVEEVKKSKNVIISSIPTKRAYRNMPHNTSYLLYKNKSFFECNDEEIQYWRNFVKSNFQYKKRIQDILDITYRRVINNRRKVIGVAIREGKLGMTKRGKKKSGEQDQPALEKMLKRTKECLDKWKYEYIYLSCECDKTIEVFRDYFGENKIIYLERIRLEFDYLKSIRSMKEGVKKANQNPLIIQNYSLIDLQYIQDMYILSKCESCILPVNCGTEAAFIQSRGYENILVV